MNRREFFRRMVPATAVTVAAISSGWALGFFRRVLSRVLRKCEDYNEWPLGLIDCMTSESIHGLSPETHPQWRVFPSGFGDGGWEAMVFV